MRTSVSFLQLLQEAVRLSLGSRLILAFAIPFGLLAWGGAWVSERLSHLLPEATDSLATLWQTVAQSENTLVYLMAMLFGLGVVRASCRGPLFLIGESRIVQEKTTEESKSPTKKALLSSALVSLLFELSYWGAVVLLSFIVVIPVFLAARYNPSAAPMIAELGLILILVLSIALFYLKEFSLLYRLLAHIRPLPALELGLKLFKKHLFWSVLFGLFLMGLSLLFTFFANLAIIASDFIKTEVAQSVASAAIAVAILGVGAVIEEVLRLLFFHALAAAPKQPAIKIKQLIEEKSPGNIPSV